MKISRFIQFLSVCALLFGSTVHAGSLSRAIQKVAPAAAVSEETAIDSTEVKLVSAPVAAREDRIVSSTTSVAPAASQSSSRRQASQVATESQGDAPLVTQVAAPPPKSSTSTPALRREVPASLAHKPATAAPSSGKIIHPTYPPKSSVVESAAAPTATTPTEEAAQQGTETKSAAPSPTLDAPSAAKKSTLVPLLAPVVKSTDDKATSPGTLHNTLRDADGGHEPPLRSSTGPNVTSSNTAGPVTTGPSVTNPPSLIAPPPTTTTTTTMRSPSDPKIVRPADLAPATTATNSTAAGSTVAKSTTPPATTPITTKPSVTSPTTTNSTATGPSAVNSSPKSADSRTHAVASDGTQHRTSPIRTSDPSQPGRLSPLRGDDEESGEKSVITRTPADAQTKQLFESEQEVPLSPELAQLKQRTQAALAHYYQNWTLNTRDHSPWEVMHAIVAYGVDTRLRRGGPSGEPMTAIGHLCFSGVCKNQPILTIRKGELYALRGPGVQGHSGQFLAILAQSYLQRDYPLYVGGQKFTLEDLIAAEQKDCEAGTELTFKLISLMHYLPSDATWKNFQGQEWSLERLIREEIVQPVRGAACGGTHRLMGLSYAVRKREQRGEPITGMYLEAQKYIDQYHNYTWSLQNPDGSFSTAWFVRKEARNDIDRRMQTTGHTLEWLAFSLSDEELRDPRMVKAVKYVTDLLLNESVSEWEIGHLGHAVHALQIYNERVFGGPIRSFEGLVSRRPLKTAQRPTQGR
jgi:hypothetical protein